MKQIIRFNNKNVILPTPWAPPGPANDEIFYTSLDGNIVTPYSAALPTIVSNTYSDGKGIIKCASDITSIGVQCFQNCTSLTSIEIPDSVTSIGQSCFYSCKGLTSIEIPDSVTTFGGRVFEVCTGLTTVVIPNNVSTIIWKMFWGCTSLTSITIPNTVTSIGDEALRLCTSLTSILYDGTKAQWAAITKGSNWKRYVPSSAVVHCTDGDTPL